jgi:hypothetical protein
MERVQIVADAATNVVLMERDNVSNVLSTRTRLGDMGPVSPARPARRRSLARASVRAPLVLSVRMERPDHARHVPGVNFQAPLARARVPTARPGSTGLHRWVRPRAPIVQRARRRVRPAVTGQGVVWRAIPALMPPRRACLSVPHARQARQGSSTP